MDVKWWICLLICLPWSGSTENQGIVELLKEIGKEPPLEPVWRLHEPGSILDDTWKPITPDNGEYAFCVLYVFTYKQICIPSEEFYKISRFRQS